MFRSNPQLTLLNHLCCFTWLAPLWLPSLRDSFLSNSRIMMSFPALNMVRLPYPPAQQHINSMCTHAHQRCRSETLVIIKSVPHQIECLYEFDTYDVIFGCSGKVTGSLRMFENVSVRDFPLNGVVANCTSDCS